MGSSTYYWRLEVSLPEYRKLVDGNYDFKLEYPPTSARDEKTTTHYNGTVLFKSKHERDKAKKGITP